MKDKNNIKQETAAVVVAYNIAPRELKENIESYINFVDKVIIVDNSDKDYNISSLKGNNIIYISLGENKGIGKALNVGAEEAIKLDYKFILTMDQDSKFKNNLLDIYSDYIDDSIGIYSPVYLIDRKRKRTFKNKVDELYWTMTSGNLLSLDAYKKIGKFNEDFFIDSVDYEYCIRLRQKEYKVVRCNEAKLEHNPGITKTKKILFWKYKYGYMSPTRLYYQVRNLSYIKDKYKSFKAWLIIKIKFFKIILLFDDKKKFLKAYKKALMAKKSNRFGKVDKINGK